MLVYTLTTLWITLTMEEDFKDLRMQLVAKTCKFHLEIYLSTLNLVLFHLMVCFQYQSLVIATFLLRNIYISYYIVPRISQISYSVLARVPQARVYCVTDE